MSQKDAVELTQPDAVDTVDTVDTVVDVVVIGAGPAGENVAGRVVDGGLTAVIVERELVGGECSYWGCIPSKTLIRPGDVLAAARRVPEAASERLWHAVPSFPTLSEIWLRLLEAYGL